jgi:hypothetical protein
MIARLLAIIFILVATTGAHAQVVGWNMAAHGCVATAETSGKYVSTGAIGVQHGAGKTGTLVFICPVDRFDNTPTDWVLRMSYRDSTGTANTASVVARLYRVPKDTFAPVAVATLNSDSFADTTNNAAKSASSFAHTFGFDANAYFIRVTLTRAAANQIVRFYSVGLEEK